MNGMDISTDASFFTVEKRILGKNVVSWSATKTVEVFLYTRVKQSSSSRRENDHANSNGGGGGGSTHGDGTALFLCWNKECFGSTNPTAAVCEKSGLLVESCVYCGSSRAMKTRRCINVDRKVCNSCVNAHLNWKIMMTLRKMHNQ
eukprot:8627335-Ditylum_brightwellii.AAC.1